MGCLKNVTRSIFLTVVIVGFVAFGGSDFIWTNELSGARFEQTKEDAEWYIHLIAEKQNIDKIVVKEVEITIL